MPSYLVTGASRGIGWECFRQLASHADNTVIGLVRNKAETEKKVANEFPSGRERLHIIQGDITDYASLQTAATETAQITGGGLDYLIANAGVVSHFDAYDPIGVLGQNPTALEEELTHLFRVNVIGNIHLFNVFLPLIQRGTAKKVIAISSGQAALDMIPKLKIEVASLYAISKAALNTAVAKFGVQYAKEGILFMSICPGMVDTGHYVDATPEQMQGLMAMLGSFAEYAPHFKGPASTEAAVKDVLAVMEKASVEKGDVGTFVSHYGNQQWL
ncbi:NAD(P)-binding protein [Aspergillus saccharolyticus JOP 1030-1]|uniref:NAD(P)-binding protein n=1 Tax=Aspergillus saccharolyticus JOP 1030-1 TaxID=1450539 RepID=A0A318ZGN9_9EURO|nr:NAD(P)-binding protein [Aspergillus saccharolyticus JOP 1030-1]PYH46711.1 NAD(P)-binding protein [Aspergillus saccharolyticus JOP 1030-1]